MVCDEASQRAELLSQFRPRFSHLSGARFEFFRGVVKFDDWLD